MSIINRNNYEEYFLLYTDDELSAAEKREVEEFVEQHPDLKIELEMLQRSVLPSEPVIFYDKEVLLKTSSSMINDSNYEEYFVLYADEELTDEEKDCVEQFVYQHPKRQQEFDLIQQAKLQADAHIVFPDKAILYRTEEEVGKVIAMRWWRIAIAAVLVVFLSGLGWYMISANKTQPPTAEVKPANGPGKVTPDLAPPKQDVIAQSDIIDPSTKTPGKKDVVINKPVRNKVPARERESDQVLRVDQNRDKINEGRNIQIASAVTNEKARVEVDAIRTNRDLTITERKQIIDEPQGPVEANPYVITTSNDDEIEILNTTISKKNKLRGLLRKVSRVVEKTTNIEGDGRGVRFANVEIALK